MQQFKVGDRVKDSVSGWTGEITLIGSSYYEGGLVQVSLESDSGDTKIEFLHVSQLELVEPAFEPRIKHFEEIGKLAESLGISSFEQSVRYHTSKIADLLIEKNKAYGDSALNPVRIFSQASRIEQLNVRIDDKISRIQRGTDYGDEDTVRDLIGYLVLRLIAEESE